MSRIGVFVCHCGENISRTVDVERVAAEVGKMPGVAFATDYKYICSDPGQGLLKKAIQEQKLSHIVVAACSPRMHEKTFRKAAESAGLNPFLCEIANIREHCSWVHENREEATKKAVEIVGMMVERVKKNRVLPTITVPVTKRSLIIGGGIAGIQAALDIADAGYEVVLVEREPSIGGHMAQLSETFPTLDCSQCIMTPKMVDVVNHPKIKLYTYAEVEHVEGYIGNFQITIRKKARFVDEEKCTGCGLCMEKCPVRKIPNQFDCNLGLRPAIYVPFPQAVPNTPVIDREHCLRFKTGKCGLCQKICGPGAVDYEQEETLVVEEVGAIVVATGFDLYSITEKPKGSSIKGYGEFGHGKIPDVIDGMTFERLASASGPPVGKYCVHRTDRNRSRSSSSSVWGREPGKRGSPTAPKSAACIPPSIPCSTNTRCMMARPTSFSWMQGCLEKATTNSGAGPLKRRKRSTSAAWSPGFIRRGTR